MRNVKWILCMLAVVCASYAYAGDKMPSGVQEKKSNSGMVVLANAKGMTLYTFDKDMKGMSMCTGECIKNWPPLTASADAKPMGNWTIVEGESGKQWAYKDKPLYTFVKDTKAGDTTGDGAGGVWHAAMP